MAETIIWTGLSGTQYQYGIYPLGTNFVDKPGNYIFAKEVKTNTFSPVYIGQTGSLKDRLADHEKEGCAKQNGATHIHVHTSGAEAARLAEERDLITKWNPVCNDQLVR